MKPNKNKNNILAKLQKGELSYVNDLFNRVSRVKAGRGLVNWFNKLVDIVFGGKRSSLTRSTVVFTRKIFQMRRSVGIRGVVLYLKACHVLLMQAHAGHIIPSTRPLGVAVARSEDGYPRIIPSQMRRRMRAGDHSLVRLWLSLFSIYRLLSYPSRAKLSTITTPGVTPWLESSMTKEITYFFQSIGLKPAEARKALSSAPIKTMIYKSSPAVAGLSKQLEGWKYSSSWLGIQQAAVSLYNDPVWTHFVKFYSLYPLWPKSDAYGNLATRIEKLAKAAAPTLKPGPIGRLGFKQEAAGKVRVFAMVDCWTQWLLQPLHLAIFDILDRLPTDGTHDQMRPITRLIKNGETRFWSFDLSAATDRLPVWLQAYLLNYLLGDQYGRVWANLLVKRFYDVPKSEGHRSLAPKSAPRSVMYAVGQPMGALSSWAMLALTHHFLVHLAAKRAGFVMGTFWAYAILGDDIVIANGKVARSYSQLMLELGVGIGFAKSLVSRKGHLEFAKRYICAGIDTSTVALKEVAAAVFSSVATLEFVRKYKLGIGRMSSVLGYGYRVKSRLSVLRLLPKRLRNLSVAWYSPFGVDPVPMGYWVMMKSALKPMILNSVPHIPDLGKAMLPILETVERKLKTYVKGTTGFTYKDVPLPKSERAVVKPKPEDDLRWLTYFTLRDQILRQIHSLKIDLRTMQFHAQRLRSRVGKWVESDLETLWELRRDSQLLRTVKQILVPPRAQVRLGFDEVIKLRTRLEMSRVVGKGPSGENTFIMYSSVYEDSK